MNKSLTLIWILFGSLAADAELGNPSVIWEKTVDRPISEVKFSPSGNFAALVSDNITIIDSTGGIKTVLPKKNTPPPGTFSVAINAQEQVLVWESPNLLRWIDPLTGTESRRLTVTLPRSSASSPSDTSFAQFSSDGALFFAGWNTDPKISVLMTDGAAEAFHFENQLGMRANTFSFFINDAHDRLFVRRTALMPGSLYFQILDLAARNFISFPFRYDRCAWFDTSGPDGLLRFVISNLDTNGNIIPMCEGENVVSADQLAQLNLSRTGKVLAMHAAIAKLDSKSILYFDKTKDVSGQTRLPQLFMNRHDDEAFGVWQGNSVEMYDVSVNGEHQVQLGGFLSPWDSFIWLDGSVSPRGDMILIAVIDKSVNKIVAIENPFKKPVFRAPQIEISTVKLRWTGGNGIYRVFSRPDLDVGSWSEIAATTNRSCDVNTSARSNYFRIEVAD